MSKKKTKKIILICIILIILYLLNIFVKNIYESIYGNEEKRRATYDIAKEYINKKYPDNDYIIEDVYYFNVSAYYIAKVKSISSIDTYFEVAFQDDKLIFDNYEHSVQEKYNTYERLDKTYGRKLNYIESLEDFPFKTDIFYGEIILRYEDNTRFDEPKFGLDKSTLEIDKKYDIRQIAKTSGKITINLQSKEISYQESAKFLLQIKKYLDEKDLPFYAINFSLEKKQDKNNPQNIRIVNFLYSDIYEQDLPSRIEKADKDYKAFVEGENAKINNKWYKIWYNINILNYPN